MSLNKFSIATLHMNANNFVINGIIISKSKMTIFVKNGQTDLCGVVTFVIRDSKDHFINVTVWGTEQFIRDLNQKYTIGHVVNVVQSKVSTVNCDDTFNPITSSPLKLTVNEGFGSIELYDGDVTELIKLLNFPLKSPDLALNLADIASTRPTSDSGDLVDLFVVVAQLKPTRQIKDKYYVRDVIVVDQTVPGMYLTIWNEAWINRSATALIFHFFKFF